MKGALSLSSGPDAISQLPVNVLDSSTALFIHPFTHSLIHPPNIHSP